VFQKLPIPRIERETGRSTQKRDGEGQMTRYVTAAVVLVLAALAVPATGASQTENSFCEIEASAMCADVAVQPVAENPCTDPPDTVTLSGTIHVAVFEGENGNRIHSNWQDVRGVGFPSGATYQANEATRMYEVQRPSGSTTFVLQDERELISQGELENFIFRQSISVTIDDDGMTTERSHGEPRCTG
jgi:hypothetical protein